MALENGYAAVILDGILPGLHGFDVLSELRHEPRVPVLMLAALGDESDRIAGLGIGARDYLPKAFSMRELLARLRAVTRSAGRVKTRERLLLDLAERDFAAFDRSTDVRIEAGAGGAAAGMVVSGGGACGVEGLRVVLTVADRGPGVPGEALEKILAPFFRLDSARNPKKGGTGLGLAIVRNYLGMCGGTVAARNPAGGGLELVVTLQ
jgi:hypothetical protein